MKETNIFKDIFRLAVRLTGLFFLCIGLKDLVVQTFMVLAQARGTSLINFAGNFLPVAFTLTVAFWLLRGNGLIRMAYPEPGKIRQPLPPETPPVEPSATVVAAPELSGMDKAEQKLAALVVKKEVLPA
jgi:hypothetical protein